MQRKEPRLKLQYTQLELRQHDCIQLGKFDGSKLRQFCRLYKLELKLRRWQGRRDACERNDPNQRERLDAQFSRRDDRVGERNRPHVR